MNKKYLTKWKKYEISAYLQVERLKKRFRQWCQVNGIEIKYTSLGYIA
jgi:hypothetical protein